jgi:hypothetical protein
MMSLGELGLVAVVVAGFEVRGQGALNRLCRHFYGVLCEEAEGDKSVRSESVEVELRLFSCKTSPMTKVNL